MATGVSLQYFSMFAEFWIGAMPLLLGLWALKRWILD